MNKVYLYHGSYYSLLALIYELIKTKTVPGNICSDKDYNQALFDEIYYIDIINEKENIQKLKAIIPRKVLNTTYYVFMSTNKEKETIIYKLIIASLKYKEKTLYYRTIDCVNTSIILATKVSREAHKLKGFLRFKESKNKILFAKVSPTNNVLGLLAGHFKKRLSSFYWVIKDENRNYYALYNKKTVYYLTEENILELHVEIEDDEPSIEELWKTFFNTISIKERNNKKCQMNFMPKKYWKNIIEMEDEL